MGDYREDEQKYVHPEELDRENWIEGETSWGALAKVIVLSLIVTLSESMVL